MRRLPSHELILPLGLNTQFEPGSVAGKFLREAQNLDSFDLFKGVAKVPGSTRVSADFGAAVASLHQFEFTDLDRQRKRHQLGLASTALSRIESDLSLTDVSNGLVFAAEALAQAAMNDRLHLTSPAQQTLPTGGAKYDGSSCTRWGVLAPGTEETTKLALDSAASWSDSTDADSSTNASLSQDGGGSVEVEKSGTATSEAYIEQASLSLDLSDAGRDLGYIYLFIPAGALSKLATSGTAAEVVLGDSGLTNADHHAFSVGELLPGWNLLSFDLTSPDSTDGTGATLSSIDTVRLRLAFKSSAQVQTIAAHGRGFLWDQLFVYDEGRPTTAKPTETEVIEGYEDHTNFTTNGSNSLSTNSSSPQQGSASVDLDKSDGGTVNGDVQRAGQAYDFSDDNTNDQAQLDVFIPSGLKAKLATTGIQVTLGDSGLANESTWDFATSALTDAAWNTLTLDLTSPDSTTGTGANLASVDTIRVRFIMASAANTQSGIRVDNLRKTVYEDGNVDAAVTYRVSFLSEAGVESNGGPASASLAKGDGTFKVSLTALPTSSAGDVIARRIYRDKDGDAIYRFVAQIDDNVTTTYEDDIADSALGGATMPIAGDDELDSTPPTRFRDVAVYQNRVVGIDADTPQVLWISDVNLPEQFRIVDQLQLDDELVALETHALGLLVYATDRVYLMTGDGVLTPFRVDLANDQLGTNGRRTVMRAKGVHVIQREDEVFLVSNPADPWFLNGPVLDQFQALSNADLADAHWQHDRSRFRFVAFAKAGATYDTALVYQYGTLGMMEISGEGGGTDPQDIRQGTWWTLSLPSNVDPRCSAMVERTADRPELWVGGGDGYVYWLQDPSATSYADGVGTEAIAAVLETHAVPLGGLTFDSQGQAGSRDVGRGEPRYLQVAAESASGATWSVTVTLLTDADGAAIGTKTFNLALPAGTSSPIVPIPDFGKRGEWCRVKLTNSTTGEDTIFRRLRLYYIPRSDFRGPRSS